MIKKRILTLLAALTLASSLSFAQTPVTGAGSVIFGSVAPSGSCSTGDWYVNTVSSAIYICSKGSWLSVGGGSGGAALNLSNLTSPTAINLTTLTFAGAAGLTAGGTNQNITLAPSGNGELLIKQAASATGQFFDIQRSDGHPMITTTNVGGTFGTTTFGSSVQFSYNPIMPTGALSSSATLAPDSRNSLNVITLIGNVTAFSFSGSPAAGIRTTIIWIQDATGGRTVSGVAANIHGFTTPGTTASTYSIQTFYYTGSVWVAGVANTNIP